MKIIFFLIFSLVLFCLDSMAQKDSTPAHQVYFEIGGQTSCFFGGKYIMPDTTKFNAATYTLIGFKHKNSSNINIGFNYQYTFMYNFNIVTGLLFNDRRYIYESDSANLKIFNHFHPDTSIFKFDIHKNNLELKLLFGYTYKQFGFFIGSNILLATFEIKYRHSIDGNKDIKYGQFSTVLGRNYDEQVFYPEILVTYTVEFKKISPIIYVGLDNFIHFYRNIGYNLNIIYGVKIPIIPKLKKQDK
jgi:hypothetical protein